jgi:hypothetical protein
VTTKLDSGIRDLAIQAAKAKVIDLSEYIRSLVIEDLDRRRMLSYSPWK